MKSLQKWALRLPMNDYENSYETKYSGMDQIKFVEDSL